MSVSPDLMGPALTLGLLDLNGDGAVITVDDVDARRLLACLCPQSCERYE